MLTRGWKIGVISFAAVIFLSVFAFVIFQPVQVLPRVRLAPGFTLTDQSGERVTSEDLRGKFVLYSFTYTNCPPPCGDVDATVQAVRGRLNEVELYGNEVAFVTISVDPERDTPEALALHAADVGADATWRFATTDDLGAIKDIVGGGFHTFFEQQDDGTFVLDPAFVLVDGYGIIRNEYRYQTVAPDVDRIVRHIGVLAEEVEKSTGAATLAYEAAHLFLCYSP
ncbi:MAG: SCO family protein [Acidimicrobiia bacterium]